jgi:hypothetical protein
VPPTVPVPALNNPLQPSTSSFTLGQANQFSVSGTNLSSTNISNVVISSTTSGISWVTNNFSVTPPATLNLSGTPSQSPLPPGSIGNLTVTINKNTPNENSAGVGNISYNAVAAGR